MFTKRGRIVTACAVSLCVMFVVSLFAGCGAYDGRGGQDGLPEREALSGNAYAALGEMPFVSPSEQPHSMFSLTASTAAYPLLRRTVRDGYTVQPEQVVIEEILNYFHYDYPQPGEGEILSLSGQMMQTPWNADSVLLSVGVRAAEIQSTGVPNNLVFLIDTSGSMNSADRLGLLKQAFTLLLEQLTEDDRVSVVTYAGRAATLLQGARGDETQRIEAVLENLNAGGSTAGGAGIIEAYRIAEEYFIEDGNNRILLATDGDFNVGSFKTADELEQLVTQKRESGVYLSILGFGMGNYQNDRMTRLADKGNGNASYIDSLDEARKVLGEELYGTLYTLAKDAKAQVSFNPDAVESYRIIGHEQRQLSHDAWENPVADAGEIGSGHTVTAVYEVVLKAGAESISDVWMTAKVRYKLPKAAAVDDFIEVACPLGGADFTDDPNDDFLFISAVVEAALALRRSEYRGTASIAAAVTRMEAIREGFDVYKTEFLELMQMLL